MRKMLTSAFCVPAKLTIASNVPTAEAPTLALSVQDYFLSFPTAAEQITARPLLATPFTTV